MESSIVIRLTVFLSLFILFALLEWIRPRRAYVQSRPSRWKTNLGLTLLNTLTLRIYALALPLLAVGAALDAQSKSWGLFNNLNWTPLLELLLIVLILDFAIWLQHMLTHKIPLLWRIHRVHHADCDMDVSTAVRFHPMEIFLSMTLKIGLVYLLGPSALAIICFEILLNGTTLFNHSNVRIPPLFDHLLRIILVTPDMHRVHHSIRRSEHDRNFGFSLSIWDRIFGTYQSQPENGHDDMIIGLEWQDDRSSRLTWSLLLPFRHN
ncbi:MAG: sterol desaturase family protein [Aestuariivita sp.]|nr:sterol desaturase family protein [Aestuariivita sp.]